MILQNWWYTTLLNVDKNTKFQKPLVDTIETDYLVVGGGMAGLHAALTLVKAGKKVVLLEKNICGGSSTGKSAGFLTPDSELELAQLERRYGKNQARELWKVASDGIEQIVYTIKKYKIVCDFHKQDSLFLGIGKSGIDDVESEAEARKKLGFTYKVYSKKDLNQVIGGNQYRSGIRYSDTYAINPLLYAQGVKKVLLKKGVKIFESTEVKRITGQVAKTHLGSVYAKKIVVCIDKITDEFSTLASESYHAQTFLSVSEPLSEKEVKKLFPNQNLLCWDSKLVYSYFRLTGDNRILLGGGTALTTFAPNDITTPEIINGIISDFKKKFPQLENLQFIQYWPGRIDTTKDLMPIIDTEKGNKNNMYVIGCVGLPWAAFSGMFAAKRLLNPKYKENFSLFFSAKRNYLIPKFAQKILGKMITFSLNNLYSKYFQKDQK